MSPKFNYFDSKELLEPIDSYASALSVVLEDNLIIDSAYLEVIEAAHRGDVTAVCEIAILFGTGAPGLPKNYYRARFYTDVIKALHKGNPELEVDAFYSSGSLELQFKNYQAAKAEFLSAIKIMVEELPPERWNFDAFYYLQQVTHYVLENEAT